MNYTRITNVTNDMLKLQNREPTIPYILFNKKHNLKSDVGGHLLDSRRIVTSVLAKTHVSEKIFRQYIKHDSHGTNIQPQYIGHVCDSYGY